MADTSLLLGVLSGSYPRRRLLRCSYSAQRAHMAHVRVLFLVGRPRNASLNAPRGGVPGLGAATEVRCRHAGGFLPTRVVYEYERDPGAALGSFLDAAAAIAGRRDREGTVDRPNAARVRASPERTRANVRTSARGKTRAVTIHSFIHSLTHAFIHSFVGNSFDRTIRAVTANERKN